MRKLILSLITMCTAANLFAMNISVLNGQVRIPVEYVSEFNVLNKRHAGVIYLKCTINDFTLLLQAFDAEKKGRFIEFLEPLKESYEQSLKMKSSDENPLRVLLNTAGSLEATRLSALCFLHLFDDNTRNIISLHMLRLPEIAYMSREIDKYLFAYAKGQKFNSMFSSHYDLHNGAEALSACGSRKAAASSDGIEVSDPLTKKIIIQINLPERYAVSHLAFNQVATILLIAKCNNSIELWNIDKKGKIYESPIYPQEILAVGAGADKIAIAFKSTAGMFAESSLHILDIKTASTLYVKNISGNLRKLIFKDDNSLLACSRDATYQYDLTLGKKVLSELQFIHHTLLYYLYIESLIAKNEKEKILLRNGSVNRCIYDMLPRSIKCWVKTIATLEAEPVQLKAEPVQEETCGIM